MGGCLIAINPDASIPISLDAAGVARSVDPSEGLAAIPLGQAVLLTGSVEPDAVDLFTLGPAQAGVTYRLAAEGVEPNLAPRVAWLDATQRVRFTASAANGRALGYTSRGDEQALTLAIARPSAGGAAGYDLTFVATTGDAPIAAARGQRVVLNFAGGRDIAVASARYTFSSFDAGGLGSPYVGTTARVRGAIEATLLSLYAEYDVTFQVRTDARDPLDDGAAILHFGGADGGLVGLADDIDPGNADRSDAAIIFTDTFAIYQGMGMTPEQIGRMIGSTAAHELGHLLGLAHAAPVDHVMNITGTSWDLAGPRNLNRGPIDKDAFPIGEIDAPAYLKQTLGERPLALSIAQRAAIDALQAATRSLDARLVAGEVDSSLAPGGLRCGVCGPRN